MDYKKMYLEEDLFPREITCFIEKDYGILFYNDDNKDSFDSNHAIIYRNKISDLSVVLQDIIRFYKGKGITPNIYQSISDDGYFEEIQNELAQFGFESWTESQRYMILVGENKIRPSADIYVKRVFEWKDEYRTEIFEKANEPWETDVVKRALMNDNTLLFVAFYKGKPVGMTHCHVTNDICRVDYLLVSKESRNIGVGRAIIYKFVEYCHLNKITNCYLWPDGETAERLYYQAGFRYVETKQAGRAIYRAI